MTKKATKGDIAAIEYLHVDADPNADETPEQFKARLSPQFSTCASPPTFVIDSGNGVQPLWRLDTPVKLNGAAEIDDIELRNFALAQTFGADPSTRNVDRILRLPGTVNWPNKKKLNAGRVPCPSSVIAVNEAAYPLSAFPQAEQPKPAAAPKASDGTKRGRKPALPANLRNMLYLTGDKPAVIPRAANCFWRFSVRRCELAFPMINHRGLLG